MHKTVLLFLLYSVGYRWNNCLSIALCHLFQRMIGIVVFVSHYNIGLDAFYQCPRMCHIAHLSSTRAAAQHIFQRIGCVLYFGRHPAS